MSGEGQLRRLMFRSRSQARDNFTVFDKFCLVQKLLLTLLGRIVHDHARRACDSRQRTFWLRDGLDCDGSLEVFEGGSGTCQPNFEVGGLPVVTAILAMSSVWTWVLCHWVGPMPDLASAEQWSHPAEPIQDLEQVDNKPRATPVSVPLAKRQKHRLFPYLVCLSLRFCRCSEAGHHRPKPEVTRWHFMYGLMTRESGSQKVFS